jgi:hypothetical protein
MPTPSKPMPPLEELQKLFDYNPVTGFFTWKIKFSNRPINPGDRAGGLRGKPDKKYISLKCQGRSLQAHRVAWYMHYREDPGQMHVDHINGDSTDNRICNLRLATDQENSQNRKLGKNNTSGFKGVYSSYLRTKPYEAVVWIDGRKKIVGYFKSAEEAGEAVKKAKQQLHGDFFNDT